MTVALVTAAKYTLVGLVLSLVSSWSIAIINPRAHTARIGVTSSGLGWTFSVGWAVERLYLYSDPFGYTHFPPLGSEAPLPPPFFNVARHRTPVPITGMTSVLERLHRSGASEVRAESFGFPFRVLARYEAVGWPKRRRAEWALPTIIGDVPLFVLPSGLAASVVVYGGVAYAVIIVARSLRRSYLLRRCRCAICGYTNAGLKVCPECGSPEFRGPRR